ncbi:hypothetical protein J5N97_002614 [Dioscorea zingiberensis]|uniref:Uncharacterized protein n=1 Tax=Dioscorea zingiberensis TaxID=325984 RepID=A0A9D5HPM5_9LILI|nr:hypothetical protein J5N97_002614 [Dioscorea zingiberensis]
MSSGSTVTEEYTPTLIVHLAENGHSFEFQCDGSTTVELIQRSIHNLNGIQVNDQILFFGDAVLESHQTLAYYKLPHDDSEVFLFKRSSLLPNAPRPMVETIEVPEAKVPPPPSPAKNPHPLDEASDPAVKALASYERMFRHHFQVANAMYGSAQNKLEICKRLLREQQVQERALETVRGNLVQTFRRLEVRYTEFFRYYSQQNRCHSEILANLGKDIERLQTLKLHPAIQTESRKCLFDFLKEDKLRESWSGCLKSHRNFEGKVSESKVDFGELRRNVDSVLACMLFTGSKDLEVAIKEHEEILNQQNSTMQTLSKDVTEVKNLADEFLNCQLSASPRSHIAISNLGPKYNAHEIDQLPKVQNCDHIMFDLLDKCKNKKNDMNSQVHVCMQRVQSVQSIIKSMINKLHVFQEAMGQQDKDFENLKFVNGLSHAYRACLSEIVRRKSSMKLYMGQAGQLAERLAMEREVEVKKREEFLKSWGKYIPQETLLTMGLLGSPSPCNVNIAPYDTSLLDIDIADVDRLAPLNAVGLLSRHERNVLPKSCLAGSSQSSQLPKSREVSVDNRGKCDSVEFLGVCDSVDIAGTSKMEVENAWLKAELASAIALICSYDAEYGYDSVDDGKRDDILKDVSQKTAEALQLKDEYGKQLQTMLEMKKAQCLSYEKRIQELEQRLSDEYMQGQKLSASKDATESVLSALKSEVSKSQLSGDAESHMRDASTEPMEDASFTSASSEAKLDQGTGQSAKPREGGDENMTDLSVTSNMQPVDSARNFMDSSMLEPPRDEHQSGDDYEHQVNLEHNEPCVTDGVERMMTTQLSVTQTNRSSNEVSSDILPCETGSKPCSESKVSDEHVLELQNALVEKSKQCNEIESKLKAAMEEAGSLTRELEISKNLLDESQMNCAHLENCLHEAREEAHTHLCAAERRASEYSALRASAVKMRGLFERFRVCVTASVPVASFADSLRSLALSLASSANEDEDDGNAEFRECIRVLADKVGMINRHRAELLDCCSRAESARTHLSKELEEKKEMIQNLRVKLQLERQANKEKISFGHLELHELAAFVLNSAGHYEAVNRNCSNYFLSPESVALFTEHNSTKLNYIIGQVVHIERLTVRPPASPRPEHGDQMDVSGPEKSSSSGNNNNNRLSLTDPLFDPSSSPSYQSIPCNSSTCISLQLATGTPGVCTSNGSNCNYELGYGDGSYTMGVLGKEKINLGGTIVEGFIFGCGRSNHGLFGGVAGILGLGRTQLSLVSQSIAQFGGVFSYCLPTRAFNSSGSLALGNDPSLYRNITPISYTRVVSGPQKLPFYFVNLTGMIIGGEPLRAEGFSNGKVLMDSGTVITRLVPSVYKALRAEFVKRFSGYPPAQPFSILDTCYDLSGYEVVKVPTMKFLFEGDVEMSVDVTGILYVVKRDASQVCLAVTSLENEDGVGIIGNFQQKNLRIVYDSAGSKLGFAKEICGYDHDK